MPLGNTGRAIGAVTQLLHDRLLNAPSVVVTDITVGRPEPPLDAQTVSRLNLFLYEVQFDGHLANVSLEEGQPPPLWLELRYLMTAFDSTGESDTIEAHEILGEGIRALQDLNFFSLDGLDANTVAALDTIPDKLKLTFQDASVDLLSKIMQGSEEHYRCSIGFQVRPIMIVPLEPPSYSLLVGINYQTNSVIGEAGIQIPVLPSLGPAITSLVPSSVDLGDSLTLTGTDLGMEGLSVMFGPAELPVIGQPAGRLVAEVSLSLGEGDVISAGNHPVSVALTLTSGRRRCSNLLIGGLRPRLDGAIASGFVLAPDGIHLEGTIDLDGLLLGNADDDVIVALYRDGAVAASFDSFVRPPGPPFQTALQFSVAEADRVLPGSYFVILRVNGQQAAQSPEIELAAP
ncbi:MAG: DUF4255 domain-containing protein [Kiloniellales bacterium]|nr:DUF4255 domain-containing protein [Kiloniellales bacterium]